MYFGQRTTNTVTNRVQIDYLKYVLRWLPRVFTNNPSSLAYDAEGYLVALSLPFGSRNSPLSLPM